MQYLKHPFTLYLSKNYEKDFVNLEAKSYLENGKEPSEIEIELLANTIFEDLGRMFGNISYIEHRLEMLHTEGLKNHLRSHLSLFLKQNEKSDSPEYRMNCLSDSTFKKEITIYRLQDNPLYKFLFDKYFSEFKKNYRSDVETYLKNQSAKDFCFIRSSLELYEAYFKEKCLNRGYLVNKEDLGNALKRWSDVVAYILESSNYSFDVFKVIESLRCCFSENNELFEESIRDLCLTQYFTGFTKDLTFVAKRINSCFQMGMGSVYYPDGCATLVFAKIQRKTDERYMNPPTDIGLFLVQSSIFKHSNCLYEIPDTGSLEVEPRCSITGYKKVPNSRYFEQIDFDISGYSSIDNPKKATIKEITDYLKQKHRTPFKPREDEVFYESKDLISEEIGIDIFPGYSLLPMNKGFIREDDEKLFF